MKIVTVLCCLWAWRGLGKADSICSAEVALPFDPPTSQSTNNAATNTVNDARNSGSDLLNGAVGDSPGDVSAINDAALTESDLVDQGAQDALDSIKARALPLGGLSKRADFACTSDETCYSINDGVFCANGKNGDFHEPDGTVGNLNTGDYALADGQRGNLYSGPVPQLTATSTPLSQTTVVARPATRTATTKDDSIPPPTATSEQGAPTSQATSSERRLSAAAASSSPQAGPITSTSSPALETQSSSSSSSASSAKGGDSGASSLHVPTAVVGSWMSMIAASWLSWIFLF